MINSSQTFYDGYLVVELEYIPRQNIYFDFDLLRLEDIQNRQLRAMGIRRGIVDACVVAASKAAMGMRSAKAKQQAKANMTRRWRVLDSRSGFIGRKLKRMKGR